jgi:hypothetical protein
MEGIVFMKTKYKEHGVKKPITMVSQDPSDFKALEGSCSFR